MHIETIETPSLGDRSYVVGGGEVAVVQPIRDGDVLEVRRLRIRAIHTPGHTLAHLSYVVSDGDTRAVFTGGSLLYGAVGRTDLVSRALRKPLTRDQYASAWRLATDLPDDTLVLPTHGFELTTA